jgi:hypothetical protein
MRAEEFMNVAFSDYTMPKGDGFIRLRIRHENSKTKGRTISLYYDKCFEAIQDYLDERKKACNSAEDLVYNRSYVTLKGFIKRLGQKALKRRVYCHLLRSSAATWLSSQMNRQQLCIFFGWAFSSRMPDKYIDRNGIEMEVIDKKQKDAQYQELQTQIEKTKFENKKIKEKLTQLEFKADKTRDIFAWMVGVRTGNIKPKLALKNMRKINEEAQKVLGKEIIKIEK